MSPRTVQNMLQMKLSEQEILDKIKSGEIKSLKEIMSKSKAEQARRFLIDHPELDVGAVHIAKLYRDGLTDAQILAHLRKHAEQSEAIKQSKAERQETAPERAARLGVGYGQCRMSSLMNLGLSDEEIVRKWQKFVEPRETISAKIQRLGLKISVATTHKLMRQGKSDEELVAFSKRVDSRRRCPTSTTL